MLNINRSRSWNEMFESTKFSLPETIEIWLERIITNLYYYIINYIIVFIMLLFIGLITGKVIISLLLGFLFVTLHMSFRQRSITSKLNKRINTYE